jgi:hypothetical protein
MFTFRFDTVEHKNKNAYSVDMETTLDPDNDGIKIYPPISAAVRITTATTTVISSGPCWARIKVQGGTMGLVTIYDNTSAAAPIDFSDTPAAKDIIFGEWTYFQTGLTIVTAAATVVFVESLTY